MFNSPGSPIFVKVNSSPSTSINTKSRSATLTLPGSSSTITSAIASATVGLSFTGVITTRKVSVTL